MVHSPPRGIRNEKEPCWDGKNANGTYKQHVTTKHEDRTPRIHAKAEGKAETKTRIAKCTRQDLVRGVRLQMHQLLEADGGGAHYFQYIGIVGKPLPSA
mmetsp:Transcript_6834/g.41673  ORF Transcript_6834/g.41673 Transcript_6834/m.41673 type:complete len:99 (-) Transcript_6834:5857-6153(-)